MWRSDDNLQYQSPGTTTFGLRQDPLVAWNMIKYFRGLASRLAVSICPTPPHMFPNIAGLTGVYRHAQLIVWMLAI